MSFSCIFLHNLEGNLQNVSAGMTIFLATLFPTGRYSKGLARRGVEKTSECFPVGKNVAGRITIPAEAYFADAPSMQHYSTCSFSKLLSTAACSFRAAVWAFWWASSFSHCLFWSSSSRKRTLEASSGCFLCSSNSRSPILVASSCLSRSKASLSSSNVSFLDSTRARSPSAGGTCSPLWCPFCLPEV